MLNAYLFRGTYICSFILLSKLPFSPVHLGITVFGDMEPSWVCKWWGHKQCCCTTWGAGDEHAQLLALEISLCYYCSLPSLIIPLFLHFWSFLVFDSHYTHVHAPAPLQNHLIQCLGPRRSIPDHLWSQDSPYPVHDGYQVIFRQVFWSISK